MFDKILIANRGEIACRIMETAHKMGVKTVAIYSDADVKSKHVEMAGEAWRVGGPAVADSYLQGDKIIEIALASGAQAIHPGYGFLSENPEFVEKIQRANLRFVGPSAGAIRAMGLKDAAKKLMIEAGVPVVPGYHGDNQDPDFLATEADKIGYPVLIKARAGGGGKGMRKVDSASNFHADLAAAQREGLSSFGDAACLIEKWITTPRHIEIQVFGDDYGNVVHLFERDCSLQRRHQKVIEEAPAPGMTDDMRDAMTAAAVRCAKAICYSGAGTIEFIVDASDGLDAGKFWFMEMNTRLQVEHPVTELVAGVDLVEWQLRVASGDKLPADQSSLTLNGHAFEARIYAEDVPAGFLPATGVLTHLSFPNTARVDSGIRENDEISPWYDPMIAKIIVHGATRNIALKKLEAALKCSEIGGTKTNIGFLSSLSQHNDFSVGKIDTGLIERDLEILITSDLAKPLDFAVAGIMINTDEIQPILNGWNMWQPLRRSVELLCDTASCKMLISQHSKSNFLVEIDGIEISLSIEISGNEIRVNSEGVSKKMAFNRYSDGFNIFVDGTSHLFDTVGYNHGSDQITDDDNVITSPMPGLVKVVSAGNGESYKKGEVLFVVEAMKMEHSLTAPYDCWVSEVFVREGQQVQQSEVLVMLELSDDE